MANTATDIRALEEMRDELRAQLRRPGPPYVKARLAAQLNAVLSKLARARGADRTPPPDDRPLDFLDAIRATIYARRPRPPADVAELLAAGWTPPPAGLSTAERIEHHDAELERVAALLGRSVSDGSERYDDPDEDDYDEDDDAGLYDDDEGVA